MEGGSCRKGLAKRFGERAAVGEGCQKRGHVPALRRGEFSRGHVPTLGTAGSARWHRCHRLLNGLWCDRLLDGHGHGHGHGHRRGRGRGGGESRPLPTEYYPFPEPDEWLFEDVETDACGQDRARKHGQVELPEG